MSFIIINKKTEDAIRRALLQLQNEVPCDIYEEIERILLNSIAHKRLSIYDINNVFSLLNSSKVLKKEKIFEEHASKRNLQKKQKERNKNKSFDFVLYEHLFIVRILKTYKMKMLCKPMGFQIIKNKGEFFTMANPDACKAFRDRIKSQAKTNNNAPKNVNSNKNTNNAGGHGQKGGNGRTRGGNTR